jgi:hypothetical protein
VTQTQQPSRARTWIVFLIIVAIIAIVWLLLTRSDIVSGNISATPTLVANVLSPAPSPLRQADLEVIFEDNFDHTVGDWELSPVRQAQYIEGVMYLEDTKVSGVAWSRPHLRFQDFVLDVDSRWLGGSVGGTYGIRIRLLDSGESLGFYLHNDGWFNVIDNERDEDRTTILYEAYSPAINRAGEANHIHIEAHEESFRFFVNGVYLVDVLAAVPDSGDIMFVAEKVEGTDAFRVGFDNLVIGIYPPAAPVQ